MSALADAEIRRLIKFLREQVDAENLAFIEDEMRSEFGLEFLRESDIHSYFPNKIIEISVSEIVWKLKIISYTRMRMTQRGIGEEEIIALFESFLRHCTNENQTITVGAYTIYGKPTPRGAALTLRIDVDETDENENRAHTVTIFVGRGEAAQTEEINLIA